MQLLRDNLTLWTSDMQVRSWKVSLRYEDMSLECYPTSRLSLPIASGKATETQDTDCV
jgi:hypothetical protein